MHCPVKVQLWAVLLLNRLRWSCGCPCLLYSPLSLLFIPLFHGIRWCAQLKITAKFCKWRWRRRRHLNEMLRTLPGQWRHDSTHAYTCRHIYTRTHTHTQTDAHSSQRIMMPGRRRWVRAREWEMKRPLSQLHRFLLTMGVKIEGEWLQLASPHCDLHAGGQLEVQHKNRRGTGLCLGLLQVESSRLGN